MGEFLEKSRDLPVDQAWQVAIIRFGQDSLLQIKTPRDFDAPLIRLILSSGPDIC